MSETNEILMRIEKVLTAILRSTVADQLAEIRADKTLRTIFDMTGEKWTVAEIAKKSKVSTGKVSGLWQSWEEAGLIVKDGKSYKKLVG